MKRGGPLKRSGPLRRKKATKRANRDRKAERFRRTFGPESYADWLRAQPCWMCGNLPVEIHHEPTRAAGGLWTDTLALCLKCHRRRHRVGVKTFWGERNYGIATSVMAGAMVRPSRRASISSRVASWVSWMTRGVVMRLPKGVL